MAERLRYSHNFSVDFSNSGWSMPQSYFLIETTSSIISIHSAYLPLLAKISHFELSWVIFYRKTESILLYYYNGELMVSLLDKSVQVINIKIFQNRLFLLISSSTDSILLPKINVSKERFRISSSFLYVDLWVHRVRKTSFCYKIERPIICRSPMKERRYQKSKTYSKS